MLFRIYFQDRVVQAIVDPGGVWLRRRGLLIDFEEMSGGEERLKEYVAVHAALQRDLSGRIEALPLSSLLEVLGEKELRTLTQKHLRDASSQKYEQHIRAFWYPSSTRGELELSVARYQLHKDVLRALDRSDDERSQQLLAKCGLSDHLNELSIQKQRLNELGIPKKYGSPQAWNALQRDMSIASISSGESARDQVLQRMRVTALNSYASKLELVLAQNRADIPVVAKLMVSRHADNTAFLIRHHVFEE